MKENDYLALDGYALNLFLAVLEEGSVTAAANRLGLTQSAVSHALQKLSRLVGTPLFVKSGRGIVATAHAHRLAIKAHELLDQLAHFAQPESFDPTKASLKLTIAANDFQADLLLPGMLRRLATQTEHVTLSVRPSGSPTPEILRERRCDLIISPFPPVGTDIFQRKLLEDRFCVFFDASVRGAPTSQAAYLEAKHITVAHSEVARLEFDKKMEAANIRRDIRINVASFSSVASFLRGSDMIATLPSLLGREIMRDFACAEIPTGGALLPTFAALPLYMAWHQRDHHNPVSLWTRQVLLEVAHEVLASR